MGRPQSVTLGPFTGGLNNAADASSIADQELSQCNNFFMETDGSYTQRPGINLLGLQKITLPRVKVIGKYSTSTDNYAILCASNDALDTWAVYALNISTKVVTEIVSGVKSTCAIQYQSVVYVFATSDSGTDGGYWDGTDWTTQSEQRRGGNAVVHKTRLWVVPDHFTTDPTRYQLWFTDPIPVGTTDLSGGGLWNAENFLPVGQGDGQQLIDIVVYNDNLLLLKTDSTYYFAFDSALEDGILKLINSAIGVGDLNRVVAYENSLFLVHRKSFYSFSNFTFSPIGDQISILKGSIDLASYCLCLIDHFLICSDAVHGFVALVLNLETGTWTAWLPEDINSGLINNGLPYGQAVHLSDSIYVVSTPGIEDYGVVATIDIDAAVPYDSFAKYSNADALLDTYYAAIVCSISTKEYNFNNAANYKRLTWWGADINFLGQVVGQAYLAADGEALINDTTTKVGDTNDRSFVKFPTSFRFRNVVFTVKMQAPTYDSLKALTSFRLFNLNTTLGVKELVPAKVN